MAVDSAQSIIQDHLARIIDKCLIAKHLQSARYPAPPIHWIRKHDADVVGHVEGMEVPHDRQAWLQFGNPVGKLHDLDKFLLLHLQLTESKPEDVDHESPEPTECNGGEHDRG